MREEPTADPLHPDTLAVHIALARRQYGENSEALYLSDPDGNGVELYWDRPKDQWPSKPDGSLQMFTHPLDLHDLLAELDKEK